MFFIRPYNFNDLASLYSICLKTGDSGKDASSLYKDPELLGHFYAAPYAVLEPELCSVLEDDHEVCAYIVGTADSFDFARHAETQWFPDLREKYSEVPPNFSSADRAVIKLIHEGYQAPKEARDYPAHLHIDLLPQAQGQGFGKKLLNRFCDQLRQKNIPGLHLGVSNANLSARGFYEKYGFLVLKDFGDWSILGLKL